MKRVINKTKWKKIKKDYQRVMQNMTLDEEDGSVFVMQHYRKRLSPGNHIVKANKMVCDSLNTANT